MRHIIFSISMIAVLLPGVACAQEREWILDAAEDDAFLVFGVPETDDVGVSFWCKIGSGKIKIFFPEGSPELKPDTTANFKIVIDGKESSLSGQATANEMTGATSIEVELPLDDPLVGTLQKADRFSAEIGGHTMVFPLLESDLGGLLRLCRPR